MDNYRHSEPKNDRLQAIDIILSVILPLIIFGPLTYLFIACFIDSGEPTFLILFFISVILYVWFVYSLIKNAKKGSPATSQEQGLSLRSKIMFTAMGAKLINKVADKEKHKSEEWRKDTFFWQDSIRDKEE